MIVTAAASHSTQLIGAPKVAAKPMHRSSGTATGPAAGTSATVTLPPPDPGTAQRIGYNMLSSFGWSPATYYSCLNNIYTRRAAGATTPRIPAAPIPQALPADKMASAGADWMTNPVTQIKWGLG